MRATCRGDFLCRAQRVVVDDRAWSWPVDRAVPEAFGSTPAVRRRSLKRIWRSRRALTYGEDQKGSSALNGEAQHRHMALMNSIIQSTVGVTSLDAAGIPESRIGTGTLVSIGSYEGILTARHVVEGSRIENLRFMAPDPDPGYRVERILPVVPLNSVDVFEDEQLDLAFILIRDPASDSRFSNFRALPEVEVPTPTGRRVLILGYPRALIEPVNIPGVGAAARTFEQPTIVAPSPKKRGKLYDPDIHLRMTYPPSRTYQADGFSGCGVWGFDFTPREVFRPVPLLCGVVVLQDQKPDDLIAVNAHAIRSFLLRATAKFSGCSASSMPAEDRGDDGK